MRASPAYETPSFVLASAEGIAYTYGGCETSDLLRRNIDNCNMGFGNMVKIDHSNGYYTLYAHLSSITVSDRMRVMAGDVIGLEGNTGKAGGKHIHWSLHRGDASIKRMAPSVPIKWVWSRDVTGGDKVSVIRSWRDFVCGQRSFEGAHRYESDNKGGSNVKPFYGLPNETSCYSAFFGLGPRICVEKPTLKGLLDYLSF